MSQVREATLLEAVRVMAVALEFYRDGDWNRDYPGGIDLGPPDFALDVGGRAAKTLRHPSVRRAVAAATPRLSAAPDGPHTPESGT